MIYSERKFWYGSIKRDQGERENMKERWNVGHCTVQEPRKSAAYK